MGESPPTTMDISLWTFSHSKLWNKNGCCLCRWALTLGIVALDTMTQMDYKYSLLGSTVDDYRKRPLLLQVDNTPMNLFAVLEVKRDLTRRSSTVGCKIRLYGFLFVLAIMFLIMASYVLTGDKKGLLLTPSPYHLNGLVSPGPFAFNLSSVGDYAHIKLVVKSIKSKVEFRTQRQCPDRKALMRSDPHVSKDKPFAGYCISVLSLIWPKILHWQACWKDYSKT